MKWWASLRPPVRGSIVMVLVAALVLGIVWSRTRPDDSTRQADPGRIAGVKADDTAVYSAQFRLPGGAVTVNLNPFVDELQDDGDYAEAEYRVHRPPPGGRVVEVGWSTSADRDWGESAPDGLRAEQLPAVRLTLQSGSQRELLSGSIRLPDSRREVTDTAAFAFDSREPLVATLQFAGRRQSVDLMTGHRKAGAFASLYGPRKTTPREQIQESLDHRHGTFSWESDLQVADQRTPYLAGLGWARKGREWLVLTQGTKYSVSDRDGDGASAQWSDRLVPTPVGSVQVEHGRLARKSPARAVLQPRTAYEPAGAAFDVPSGEPATLRFTIRVPVKSAKKGTPRTVGAMRSLVLPAVPGGGVEAL